MNNTEKKIQSAFSNLTPEQAETMVKSISPADYQTSSKSRERIQKEVLNRMEEKKTTSTNMTIKIISIAACTALLAGGAIAIAKFYPKTPSTSEILDPSAIYATADTTDATTEATTAAITTEATTEAIATTTQIENFEYVSKTAGSIEDMPEGFARTRTQEFLDDGYTFVSQDVSYSNIISAAWLDNSHDNIMGMALVYEFDTQENAQAFYDYAVSLYSDTDYIYVENVTDEYTELRHDEAWGFGYLRIYHNSNVYEYCMSVDLSVED